MISNLLNIPLGEKKGRSKIESNRGMENTGSKRTRPFVALYILSMSSSLLEDNSALFI